MKRTLGSGQTLNYLLLAVSVVVFAVGGYRFLNKPGPESTAYAQSVDQVTFKDTQGRPVVSEPGTWRAFLVASPTEDVALIRALRTAVENRGRDGQSVRATLLARETEDGRMPAPLQSIAPLAVVPLARNMNVLSRGLRLHSTDRQLLLVDPAGQVAFHGRHPQYSDVGLVFDRFLPLRHAPAEHAPLRVGDTLADVPLTSLAGQSAPSGDPHRLWIVFTSRCTACALNTHADVVGSVQGAVTRFASARKSEAALVFASSFDDVKVRKKMESLGMTLPVYMASSEFPAVEEAAEMAAADVLVIERDAAGRVTRLQSLPRFLQEITEDRP